jgi:clathrin heavy chain
MFKQLARYLVHKRSTELWGIALSGENKCRRQLIDQVVQTVVSETDDLEEYRAMVHSFMLAKIPDGESLLAVLVSSLITSLTSI